MDTGHSSVKYLSRNLQEMAMLLADVHEPEFIIEELKSKTKLNVIRLKHGDYSFSDTVIERKSLSDFFSSLKSGRLFEQMENISRFYSIKYLFIEGFFDFSYVNNVEYLYNQLFLLSQNFGIKIIFSNDEKQTAYFISRLYLSRNRVAPMFVQKKERVYYSAKLFGFSTRKMEKLYSHFGSILNMASAKKSDLTKVRGVGLKTLKKIKAGLYSDISDNK